MKKNLYYGALGCAALGLASCSNEVPGINDSNVAQKDEVRYVRVAISNPQGTRATEFEAGTDDENAVKSAYFKFYDAAQQPVGDALEVELELNDATTPDSPNVGKIASAVVKVSIPKGEQMPSYIVAFLNPVDWDELIQNNKSMEDLRNQPREDYKSNDGAFAMNNSVYYGTDAVTGAANVKILGTPIKPTSLYTTEAAAEAADAETVDIYVERYAAKVRFSLGDNAVDNITMGDYTLTFTPEVWSVNADAPSMYASKRFDSSATGTTIPSLNEVNSMLGTWTTWNDAPNHRSYWACSPGYYSTEFPTVSDDIIEKATGTQGTGAGVAVGPYALRYYSYNQIANQNEANTSDGKGVTSMNDGGVNWKYVLENTMGKPAFESLNPKAAAPSLVLLGGYKISKAGTEIDYTSNDGFCTYGGKLYWKGTVPASDTNGQTIMNVLLATNQILSISQTTPSLNLTNATDAVKNCFEVAHPSAAVRGVQPVPHRYVTLQLKSGLTATQLQGLYYKPTGSDVWVPLVAANATDEQIAEITTSINKMLWAQLGNARAYTNGKGYFSIPIQHLGMTENTATASPIVDGSIDWTKVRVGDFGLVRNHVYSLGVSKISGMADGIENLDNPLVPAMDENDYWIKYKLNILNWRIVPAQNGIILK